jgi:SAM-dependent methyltransferase
MVDFAACRAARRSAFRPPGLADFERFYPAAKISRVSRMNVDIIDLRQFYQSRLGRVAGQAVTMALSSVWSTVANERLMGLGYALPYLDRFRADAERSFAFMPAGQGAVNWPSGEPSAAALVFDEELPLPDAALDRILMVHSLEFTENPRETLREMWRVLAPGGRLVIVVPNRRGLWARFDNTPFGSGRPYSRGQLMRLLRDTNFTPGASAEALFFPPSSSRFMLRMRAILERFGRRVSPGFAGVIVVEAQKRLYQGLPVGARASRRVFVPVLAPQGAGAGRTMPLPRETAGFRARRRASAAGDGRDR